VIRETFRLILTKNMNKVYAKIYQNVSALN